MPFKVNIAVIERLGDLDLEGLPLEKAQEGCDRHGPVAVLHWAEIVPEEKALLLQDVPKGRRRSKGWLVKHSLKSKECVVCKTQVVFPELVGPTIMGALVVLEGPEMRMFRKAAARPVRDKVSALASKTRWAARA